MHFNAPHLTTEGGVHEQGINGSIVSIEGGEIGEVGVGSPRESGPNPRACSPKSVRVRGFARRTLACTDRGPPGIVPCVYVDAGRPVSQAPKGEGGLRPPCLIAL
uniref:Uncharacterized protein n=1 Tax=Florenciella parvula TaxID=236787 RepID=A0A7S2B7P8_9STRA